MNVCSCGSNPRVRRWQKAASVVSAVSSPAQVCGVSLANMNAVRGEGRNALMSDEPDRFFEQQEAAAKILLVERKGDELTDILVGALLETLHLLQEEIAAETVH
ncbi:hypothetical protein [Rhizobium sp. RU36D]|uniref:hypothetical protein n=1 Tax=Rhizobium sp. RU36D TaxID=1907415 RepID=UPI0015C4D8AC|nr:hypothetical protein [Rhizobium sp. RU36D]